MPINPHRHFSSWYYVSRCCACIHNNARLQLLGMSGDGNPAGLNRVHPPCQPVLFTHPGGNSMTPPYHMTGDRFQSTSSSRRRNARMNLPTMCSVARDAICFPSAHYPADEVCHHPCASSSFTKARILCLQQHTEIVLDKDRCVFCPLVSSSHIAGCRIIATADAVDFMREEQPRVPDEQRSLGYHSPLLSRHGSSIHFLQ